MSSAPTAADIRSTLRLAAEAAGHQLDREQLSAADALADFGESITSGAQPRGGGLYLWGTVGRGKTWLADALFAAVPTGRKRRVHFHSFYRSLHHDLYRGGTPAPGAIDDAISALLDGMELLYFDEFHLHDAGDATLALRVLRQIVDRRVPLLATSNYPPSGLLPDPIFHHLFEPGIRLIEAEFDVIALDGTTDYRRRARSEERREGFSRGSWLRPGILELPGPHETAPLRAGGHATVALRADATQLWVSFDELCERPTSASDYLEWAERWPRWVVVGVPPLATCSPQARQRFLNLVDVLNDRGVDASFISEFTPEEVLASGPALTARGAASDREELGLGADGLPIDVARTASRLALLRRARD